jgi:hypothetical protein
MRNDSHPLAVPLCLDPLEHIFAKSSLFPFYMREGEMIFYHQTGDDGKGGEHPHSLHLITGDIYMISYIFIDV